ncbi:protein tincar [Elysia marginata]|uniref:Protein tincar n=1 Tax=Elysia marginata TaxID=1093978 RepID=A0AAV4IGM5_9GAST|nr:protein tincar [Elysia marginata]
MFIFPGEAWRTDMDFLYPTERAFYSEIRSSVNASLAKNASHVRLETPHIYVTAWGDRAFDVHVSIAFANFCFALGCFLVRYASVFWYTNKPLTAIFALQLLAMVLNSVFSFSSFSTLYCISCNQRLYPNVSLSLRCGAVLVLYLIGSTVLLASTVAVFEYGCHYFHEKFEVVSRHRETESYVKRTLISNNGCQGYVPHLCAMAALVLSAVCKGPLLYDLVSLMRLTDDQMLLAGIVCEVSYMVMWLVLWFFLTLKQQWQFRILDYVALRPPPSSVVSEDSVRSNQQMDRGDGVIADSLTRSRRLSGRENFPQRFLEAAQAGTNSSCEEPCPSDIGTDESDGITSAAEMVLDLDGNPIPDRNSSISRNRSRRAGGQRVTFDESVRSKGSSDGAQNTNTSAAAHQLSISEPMRTDETNALSVAQLNVAADVHSSSGATSSNTSNESSSHGAVMHPKTSGGAGEIVALSRDYRNSIRSKCGELYSSSNNLSSSFEEATAEDVSSPEPLPTLMSSFRDKVRESSIAASNFKERERHMLEQFDYLDPPAAVLEDVTQTETDKRRCMGVRDESDVNGTNSLDRHGRDVSKYPVDQSDNDHGFPSNLVNGRYRPRSKSYDQSKNGLGGGRVENTLGGGAYDFKKTVNSSSLPRSKAAAHNSSVSSDEGHRSSFSNSTHESSDLSLSIPPAMEDLQRGRMRLGSAIDRRSLRDDYLYHHLQHTQQPQQPHHHLQHPLHTAMVGGAKDHLVLNPRPLQVLLANEEDINRRDSANYSLTSSQETSSNESDQGQGLCSQV